MLRLLLATLAVAFLFSTVVVATARQCGVASYYRYTGHRTASGEVYTGRAMTAAHRTLPFNTMVRVTDQRTGRSIVVRISDRGPFIKGRIIDLSPVARMRLGMGGLASVCLEPEPT